MYSLISLGRLGSFDCMWSKQSTSVHVNSFMCECKRVPGMSIICGWAGIGFSFLQYKQSDIIYLIRFWYNGIQK